MVNYTEICVKLGQPYELKRRKLHISEFFIFCCCCCFVNSFSFSTLVDITRICTSPKSSDVN